MSIIGDIKAQFRERNVLLQIIIVNAGLFLLVKLTGFCFYLAGHSADLVDETALTSLALPYDPNELLHKPWTIITHFFTHLGLPHIFWNLVTLYVFGKIFVDYAGNNRILSIYFYGALAGAALSFVVYELSPRLREFEHADYMLGASAGIMAIVLGIATLVPNASLRLLFIGEVQLKYIALFFVLIDLISLPYYSNSGGHIAHLGGAAFGSLFMFQFKRGRDWSKGFNRFFDFIRTPFIKGGRARMKVVYNRRKKTDEDFNQEKNQLQQRVDHILDKISRSGYESLSKEEKDILFRSSNKL